MCGRIVGPEEEWRGDRPLFDTVQPEFFGDIALRVVNNDPAVLIRFYSSRTSQFPLPAIAPFYAQHDIVSKNHGREDITASRCQDLRGASARRIYLGRGSRAKKRVPNYLATLNTW